MCGFGRRRPSLTPPPDNMDRFRPSSQLSGLGSGLSNSHPIPVKTPLITAIQTSMSRRTSMAARPMSFVEPSAVIGAKT